MNCWHGEAQSRSETGTTRSRRHGETDREVLLRRGPVPGGRVPAGARAAGGGAGDPGQPDGGPRSRLGGEGEPGKKAEHMDTESTARAQKANIDLKVIRANRFVLEDEDGAVRAALTVNKRRRMLSLADENGKVRALLTVGENGPSLPLFGETGEPIWSQP